MHELLRDFRYACRVLLKSPAATTVAVLALALGIGVNASAFVSIDSIVLHPFAYPRLDRIMTVWENTSKSQEQNTALAPADFLDVAKYSRSFESFAAYRGWNASLSGSGNPQTVQAYQVSPGFFTTLGMKAAWGRTIAADEDRPGRSNVVVVSEAFWKSQLAGSKTAIDAPLKLNGRTYTVVGVMPDKFDFPLAADIWAPLTLEPADGKQRGPRTLFTIGLLKPGVAVDQARAELA